MAWNGAGVFNRLFSWTADKAAAINITASRMDSDTNDIVTQGLGNCITRDGQGQPTANLPMATFRHTGVANGVARTDYAAMGQLEDGTVNWAAAGGGADALAATYIPALTALVDGQLCWVRAAAANATTTPTFAPNGLTVHTITKVGGAPLAVGDIAGSGHELILRYKLASTIWELLNPALPVVYSNDPGALGGPILDIFRDSASPAASDIIGRVDWNGRDSAGNKQLYATAKVQITDPTSAAESAVFQFQEVIAGTLTLVLQSTTTQWSTALILALTNVTNALSLSGGTTAQRNGSPTAGDTRYNTSLNGLEYWNGTAWIVLGQQPTVQRLTSGSAATFTPSPGAIRHRVRMWGSGAGGGAQATNNGTAGNATSFQVNSTGTAWTANGGSAGPNGGANTSGGAGGTGGATGSTGALIKRVAGSAGGASNNGASATFSVVGGAVYSVGLFSPQCTFQSAGFAAPVNSGGGGGGALTSGTAAGGGGGGGEYVEFWVTGMTTATYTVGALALGGVAGTRAGGDGGSGCIEIEEFYS